MPRMSGRDGQVFVQLPGGTKFPYNLLVDTGDHRTFVSGTVAVPIKPWTDNPKPLVRQDGVRSGLVASPAAAASADTVDITAGNIWQGGVAYAVAASTGLVLGGGTPAGSASRPTTAGDVVVSLITINASQALTVINGTQGVAGGAMGAAGGQPFTPVGSILLTVVTRSVLAATALTTGEIDNTAAERADIPGFTPDHFNGQVALQQVLPLIHTGSTPRNVYAQFTQPSLGQVYDLNEWTLDVSKDLIDTEGFTDTFKRSVPAFQKWSATCKGYVTSTLWYNKAILSSYVLVQLKFASDATTMFQGIANLDWSAAVPATGAVTENIKLTGAGPIVEVPVLP